MSLLLSFLLRKILKLWIILGGSPIWDRVQVALKSRRRYPERGSLVGSAKAKDDSRGSWTVWSLARDDSLLPQWPFRAALHGVWLFCLLTSLELSSRQRATASWWENCGPWFPEDRDRLRWQSSKLLRPISRIYKCTSFYCALLSRTSKILHVSHFEGLWQLGWASLLAPFFWQRLLMFLCHILVIIAIFQTFSALLYLLWLSVTSDLWRCCCN